MKIAKILRMSILFVLVFSLFIPTVTALAADKTVYSQPYYSSSILGNTQHRFITITKDPKWTSYKWVSGQPSKGTYLKKGDSLYYGESGGAASISFVVGYGCASVSFNVPLGKANSSHMGKSLKANKSGYYKIRAKKYIQPTIKLIQYRYRTNGKWGSWRKASYYSKSYKVVRSYSELVSIK